MTANLSLRPRLRPLALALALAGAAHAACAAGIVFDARPLASLGGSVTTAAGLNDAGTVVGASLVEGDRYFQPFIDDGTGMRAVGGVAMGQARAINNAGAIVGTLQLETGESRAFVSAGGTVTPISAVGGRYATGQGINAAGHVVGEVVGADGIRRPFLYAEGRMTTLGAPGAAGTAGGINDRGQIVGTAFAGNGSARAFVANDGVLTDLHPTLGGSSFSFARAINNRGQIVGTVDGAGFIYDAGNVRRLTAAGVAEVLPLALNDAGLVVGVTLGSDPDETQTAFIVGSTGSLVDLNSRLAAPTAGRLTEAVAVNVHGQIAANDGFRAYLLTPRGTLSWAGTAGGRLADGRQWDSGMGFAPTALLDVVIAPTASQTIAVDADAGARSFMLGAGTAGGAVTLQFERGARLTARLGMTVNAGATVTGDGIIDAVVTNHGTVRAAPGQQLTFAAGLQNHGTVGGNGRLAAALVNHADGNVRAGAGEVLVLAGSSHVNAGTVEVRQGGELQTIGRLTNQAGGTVRLDAATVRFADGIDNAGAVQIGYGGASVFGAVDNRTGAQIVASGGSATTFWDAVHNDGEIRASAGARIVYFGAVSGGGSFTTNGSGGYHRFEAGFAPGNSPARVTLGNAELTGALLMELGGLAAGSGHDQIVFEGSVLFDAGASLDVVLINGFVPHAGDAFRLFSYTQAPQGRFGGIDLPSLAGGLTWDTSDLYTDGWIRVSAVPEPATWLLWAMGGLVALRRRAARAA